MLLSGDCGMLTQVWDSAVQYRGAPIGALFPILECGGVVPTIQANAPQIACQRQDWTLSRTEDQEGERFSTPAMVTLVPSRYHPFLSLSQSVQQSLIPNSGVPANLFSYFTKASKVWHAPSQNTMICCVVSSWRLSSCWRHLSPSLSVCVSQSEDLHRFVSNSQILIVHNRMDLVGLDAVRRQHCAYCSCSEKTASGLSAVCTHGAL